MEKILDKLKSSINSSKKLTLFLVILGFIALISGTIYVVVLKQNDQLLIKEQLELFLSNISNNKLEYLDVLKNTLLSNLFYIIIIWLLGISIIGLPITVFMYFAKVFILGFSIASIFINYNFKGILFALFYIFPHQIINIIILLYLVIYSITLSLKLGDAIVKKKTIDFKPIMNKYLMVLLISATITALTSLMETYLTPFLIKLIINIIK